ncbi:MAG: hydrogenase nickel incorporation protein HypB [Chloroflexi bacterium]|nr:hydrogenase nickel incorporation protein HypB [Ardenticatenaceae bacterium]MBL1126942.1 hydrogenase accessory protein HypB [Chloroflexota bacterium]NOG32999.1 hydrogenase nickel incorporation protein HypB [Chloroflexota bacterium]GIK54702.1 MAG: hydrogenase accessory protein HypB [Chloroflexota bacterium]
MTKVTIVEEIMSANDRLAQQNRALLDAHSVFAINVMASPGAGKTSLILRTITAVAPYLTLGVIEGDTAPVTIDADKVLAAGMPAVQINTGGSCHLEASMMAKALPQLPLADLDLLVVENVGNLICPAGFKLGAHANIVVASVPEGDDKPYKYPGIYRGIDALILNKTDLLPYVDFNIPYFRQGIELLNSEAAFFPLSCKTGEGFAAWIEWLLAKVGVMRDA